jgi:hypothetical protein
MAKDENSIDGGGENPPPEGGTTNSQSPPEGGTMDVVLENPPPEGGTTNPEGPLVTSNTRLTRSAGRVLFGLVILQFFSALVFFGICANWATPLWLLYSLERARASDLS